MKKEGFTMIEVLIITIVISIGLLSIVFSVNKSKLLTFNLKQNLIANQLAKEGIELIYQIRNTNLLQYSGQKNLCWLNENPYEECNGDNVRLGSGQYIITEDKLLSGINFIYNADDLGDENFLQLALCLSDNKWISCPGEENNSKYGKFFRVIEGFGLYDKDSNTSGGNPLNCASGNDSYDDENTCDDKTAKEYRFCSKVYYVGEKVGEVEICGLLTNFFD